MTGGLPGFGGPSGFGGSPVPGGPGQAPTPGTAAVPGVALLHRMLDVWARPEQLTVHPATGDLPPGGTRSHLADGRTVTWSPQLPPGVRYAVDAEIADQSVPPALAARFGRSDPEQFWTAWTRVEVCCKLTDVPVLTWLSRQGLNPDDAVPTRTLRVGDLLVCYGVTANVRRVG